MSIRAQDKKVIAFNAYTTIQRVIIEWSQFELSEQPPTDVTRIYRNIEYSSATMIIVFARNRRDQQYL